MTLTKEMLKTEAGKRLLEETRGLVKKWDKTGLLDGLRNDIDKSKMSVILESHSTLIMEDGTRINYFTPEERERKLKEYYEVQRKSG